MTPIIVNLAILLFSILFAVVVIALIKTDKKGYKILFISYTLFWIPLMLCRQYTGNLSNAIAGNNVGLQYYDWQLWLPLAIYGFVGIFTRVFADYLTWLTKYRKSMIYLAICIGIATFIPVIIVQTPITNTIQSLGVGVGASMIGTYQLLFNEQYGKSKSFLTVSLLSIPPLIADFISSSIQSSIFSIYDKKDLFGLSWLWIIGLAIFVITLVLTFFMKEDKKNLYSDVKHKTSFKYKQEWVYFVLICLVGSLIAFVKWNNSGSIAQLHYTKLNGDESRGGYLSLIFSLGQLIGGVLTGLVLVKKIGKTWTFMIGSSLWIAYELIYSYNRNPDLFLASQFFNGFSYGLIYNLILVFIITKVFKTNVISPMGVYQSVMSIGITLSGFYNGWIKSGVLNKPGNDYFKISEELNFFVISVIVFTIIIFIILNQLEKQIKIKYVVNQALATS